MKANPTQRPGEELYPDLSLQKERQMGSAHMVSGTIGKQGPLKSFTNCCSTLELPLRGHGGTTGPNRDQEDSPRIAQSRSEGRAGRFTGASERERRKGRQADHMTEEMRRGVGTKREVPRYKEVGEME